MTILYQPLKRNGINFNTVIQSPSETTTSLQVVCFFEFEKNQHYEGGTHAVNEHFSGNIHELRKSGIFRGQALETLLISPVSKQIPAGNLLLLGLGDPADISLNFVERVGYTAASEAIKLGVTDFSFAPSLKDAGVAIPFEKKTDLSEHLVKGMLRAIDTYHILTQRNLCKPIVLAEINLLAGESQGQFSYEGLQLAFE